MHSKAVPAMKRIMATVCALAMMSGGLFAWQSTAQSSGGAPPASQKKTAGRSLRPKPPLSHFPRRKCHRFRQP